MRRLLVLRPEPGASATMTSARQRGLNASKVPLFEVEPLPWEPPPARAFDGLLLTSANSVRHAGRELHELRTLPVYAVGVATADAARTAGLSIATLGDGGVDDLLKSIAPELKLLHLCGADRQQPTDASRRITAIPVYRSKPIEAPGLGATQDSVALIHSIRAGQRFAELVRTRDSVLVAAISRSAADSVGGGWGAVECAAEPNDSALLALAARLCNKPPPE